MKIKGSGNKYYDVNLDNLTCTCKDWTCRRHNFSKDNPRRLCKHILEAMNIMSKLGNNRNPFPGGTYLIDKSNVYKLIEFLNNSPLVLRHSLSESVINKVLSTEYIPIVIKYTDESIPIVMLDYELSNLGYNIIGCNKSGNKRYYLGKFPIEIIISSNFYLQSIYYNSNMEDLIKLSSISNSKLGLVFTENGFIDKSDNIINMEVYTEEELCSLLGVDELF